MTKRSPSTTIRAWSVRYRIDKYCREHNMTVLDFCEQFLDSRYWYRQSMKSEFINQETSDKLDFLLKDLKCL